MARDLKLEVVLSALDRASRPFKNIGGNAIGLGRALKQSRDELKGLQAQQRDVTSFRTMKTESERTGAALAASRDKVRALSQQIAQAEAPTKQLNTAFNRAVREAQALKREHSQQQTQLQGLRTRLGAAGINTRNLSDHERELRSRVAATNATLATQEGRLKRLTTQQQRLATAKQRYEKTQSLAGSMAATGASGLASGSGILYAGARLLSPGLDFDASMSQVQALSRLDKTSPELLALRKQARQLGASTQFTAGQAADAQGFLAMAGFNPKAIKDAMPGMLDLAKAGGSELAETADIASNILTGFNLQADQTGRLGDVLVGTFTRSNTNLQMLGETMKYVATTSTGLNQDVETVAAMAGKLADAGLQGSMAGTALRAVLSRLAAPPKAAAKALAKLGVSAADAQGNLRDLPTVLQELYEKTKNLGDTERAGAFKAIAGEEAFNGLQVLVNQAGSGALQSFVSTLKGTAGEASRTAAVMADNMRGDLSALGSAWEDLGIQLQEQQDGPLRGITQGITRTIGSVKSWVAENPRLAGGIVKVAAGLGLLLATTGGITLAMASVLGPFAMTRYAMSLLGINSLGLGRGLMFLGKTALPVVGQALLWIGRAAMANPIGLAIAAIAGGAYLIYRNWGAVSGWFAQKWAEIKEGFNGGLAGIYGLIVNFSPLGLLYSAFAGVMNYLGVEMPSKFTEFGGMLIAGLVNGITSGLGSIKTAITDAGGAAIGWFKEKLGIHSPSRVFAELGGFTMQGLAQGLAGGEAGPLSTLAGISQRLAAAGAVAIGASGPAIAMDNRAPLTAGGSSAPAVVQGDTINITINAGAGTDVADLRRQIAQLLDERDRAKAARGRAALYDRE